MSSFNQLEVGDYVTPVHHLIVGRVCGVRESMLTPIYEVHMAGESTNSFFYGNSLKKISEDEAALLLLRT